MPVNGAIECYQPVLTYRCGGGCYCYNKKMYLKRAEAVSISLSVCLCLFLSCRKMYIKSRLLTHPILLCAYSLFLILASRSNLCASSFTHHTVSHISAIRIRDISLSLVFVVPSFTVCFSLLLLLFWL